MPADAAISDDQHEVAGGVSCADVRRCADDLQHAGPGAGLDHARPGVDVGIAPGDRARPAGRTARNCPKWRSERCEVAQHQQSVGASTIRVQRSCCCNPGKCACRSPARWPRAGVRDAVEEAHVVRQQRGAAWAATGGVGRGDRGQRVGRDRRKFLRWRDVCRGCFRTGGTTSRASHEARKRALPTGSRTPPRHGPRTAPCGADGTPSTTGAWRRRDGPSTRSACESACPSLPTAPERVRHLSIRTACG